MFGSCQKINLRTWPRRDIFSFFSSLDQPFYSVCFRVDVTQLHAYTKARGLSFYYAMTYLVTQAVNEVENLRYTIRGGSVYLLDRRTPSFTDLKKGSELFHIVTMPCEGSIETFCQAARDRSAAQECFFDPNAERDHLIYFSCLPWIDLTALTNERDLSAPQAKDDSVPRIAWGRFTPSGDDRSELGISVEVNHRLIDGVHIGMFAKALSRLIDALA